MSKKKSEPRKILIVNEKGFERFSYDAQVCWDTKPEKPKTFPCLVVVHKWEETVHEMGCSPVYTHVDLTYVYLKDFE